MKFNLILAVLFSVCIIFDLHNATAYFCAALLWALAALEYLSTNKYIIHISNSFVFAVVGGALCFDSYKKHSYFWVVLNGLVAMYCLGTLIYELYKENNEK